MAQPAAVSGDQAGAVCSPHPTPDPAAGAPQPAGTRPAGTQRGSTAAVPIAGRP
ncbi:MAG TPA: hypothetical protein VFU73_15535 [Actinocrinis sp.]|nr:hypothetical protein [Actinocrinis sp.]